MPLCAITAISPADHGATRRHQLLPPLLPPRCFLHGAGGMLRCWCKMSPSEAPTVNVEHFGVIRFLSEWRKDTCMAHEKHHWITKNRVPRQEEKWFENLQWHLQSWGTRCLLVEFPAIRVDFHLLSRHKLTDLLISAVNSKQSSPH